MDKLKILSWNICWECMSANQTSNTLAIYCKNNKNTCLLNVVDLIDQEEYDIIGLQEAAKYNVIISESDKLRKMGCIHHALNKNSIVDLTTFYNIQKFKVLAVKVGNLFNKQGRPYHIIFLQHNKTSDKYIIINLHNGHYDRTKSEYFSKDYLEKTLGADIENLFIVDSSKTQKDFMNIENEKLSNGSHLFTENTFKTIVLGDFNDNAGENYWQGLQPFKINTSFQNLSSIVVSSQKTKPPKTCCTGHSSLRTADDKDFSIGDYILIDANLKYSTHNTIVQYFMDNIKTKLTSDHKPVYAIIKIPTPALAVVPVVVPDAVLPAVPTANQKIISFICIPNLNGQFSSHLDCVNDSVSIKQSSLSTPMSLTEFKFSVINDAINKIMGKPPYTDIDKYTIYKLQLEKLYDKYLPIYVGQPLDITAFVEILKQTDEFEKFFPITCYFNKKLQSKFKEIPTLGNGNCLFQSLQLGINEWKKFTPLQIREIICNNLEHVIKKLIKIRNLSTSIIQSTGSPGQSVIIIEEWIAEILKHSVDNITDKIIEDYITQMRNEQKFGGLLEIITAIYLTRFNIIIYQMDGNLNNNFEDIKNEIKFRDDDEEFSTFTDGSAVYLYHCNSTGIMFNAEHYELLVKKPQPPIAYKYMKYKMKYLTLKNNTHYNKYL